jgi:hypothetical protein
MKSTLVTITSIPSTVRRYRLTVSLEKNRLERQDSLNRKMSTKAVSKIKDWLILPKWSERKTPFQKLSITGKANKDPKAAPSANKENTYKGVCILPLKEGKSTTMRLAIDRIIIGAEAKYILDEILSIKGASIY